LAKVLLHSVVLDDPAGDPWNLSVYKLFAESARSDIFGVHTLTEDPTEADVIIFAEHAGHGLFAEAVRNHPFVKQFGEKCFLFDAGDHALPFLPGLYASLRKQYHTPSRTRTGYYLRGDRNTYIDFRAIEHEPRYTGVFVGQMESHPVRSALIDLPRDRFLIEDTSRDKNPLHAFFLHIYGAEEQGRNGMWSHYADAMASGAFSLCPRGLGPGSVRLFESMRMGRCPVILSDEWVVPMRVDWPACSIIVAEKDVGRLPEILEPMLDRAAEMGLRARQEWEKFYAPNVRFHWLAEDCLELLRLRRVREAVAGRKVWLHLFNKRNLLLYLTSKRQYFEKSGKIIL
jgi:hypothetical protein